MDMDWGELFGGITGLGGPSALSAAEDPLAWLEHQLEADEDLCYMQVAPTRWKAKALRKSRILDVEVALDEEGFLVIEVDSGIGVTAECERECRILQMVENGSFKTAGYRMANAGENVVFRVTLRPTDELVVENIVGRCVFTVVDQAQAFERIIAGARVRDIYGDIRLGQMKKSLLAHRFSGGKTPGVEDLQQLMEAFS